VIGSMLQQDSRARSNTTRFLALFLALSLLAHGLFFPQEWIIFSFALSGYYLLSCSRRKFNIVAGEATTQGLTDLLFSGMVCFSLLGLAHPVKVQDGLMEALRWGIYWLVYRLGVRIASDEPAKKRLIKSVEGLAIIVAFIGWVPWVGNVAGRLSSVFGYPNATAAFLGAVLLLYPRSKLVQIFLGLSLLGTGSRAGVGLFLLVFIGRQFLLLISSQRSPSFIELRQRFRVRSKITGRHLRKLWLIFLGIGIILTRVYSRPAWENLMAWGFSSSSWQERLVYYKDGISLAWNAGGLPQAGGWLAFPTIQHFPYWTADPHSSFIHILLNQGILGIIFVGIWSVFTIEQVWKTWRTNRASSVSPALFFLALHSLVDADFSFGALGVLFWMLLGSFQPSDKYPRPFFSKWPKLAVNLSIQRRVLLLLSLILCLVSGSALLNPAFFEKEKSWNAQARLGSEQDPAQSIVLWDLSLNWDQTQITTRREQAEFLLKRGNTDAGLKAVDEVLRWQPLELGTYEWAQSVVWDAAEVQRRTHPETANRLYLWVESVPGKIERRVAILSLSDRVLWPGYREFQASQHINLLAEYAQQRQLTQPLPRA